MASASRNSRRSPPTNLSLLRRLRSGEPDAWSEFDRFHRDLILHWARGFGCGDALAEDVCQEAMVSLYRALPGFEHDVRRGGFHAFLKTLVRSRAIDTLRKRKRGQGAYDSASSGDAVEPEPSVESNDAPDDTAWVRTLVGRACERALERLDSATYRSFQLYAVEGLDVAETARRVGAVRSATVYQQKSRVLQAIRNAMQEMLRELDDPELGDCAAQLRGAEVVRMLADFVSGNPDMRLTLQSAPRALDRLVAARRALELCAGRDDGPWLVVTVVDRVVPLATESMVVGSRDADLLLDWPGVSGRHCLLTRANGNWLALDQDSRNGTLINGQRRERAELVDGDVLTLGDGHMVFLQEK